MNGWRVLGPGAGEGEGEHTFNRRLKVTFSFRAAMMRSVGKLVLRWALTSIGIHVPLFFGKLSPCSYSAQCKSRLGDVWQTEGKCLGLLESWN